MLVRFLGPLEVRQGDQWIRLGAPKLRSLLAALLLRPGEAVPVEWLIDQLWPEQRPRGADNRIHGYVMRLRRLLDDPGGQLLRTCSPGYELAIDPADQDAGRFEQLSGDGIAALRKGDVTEAGRVLRAALELWRGPAFTDVPATSLVQAEAGRLEERRLTVLEARIDTDLRQADSAATAALPAELQSLVSAHPMREHFWGQLMLALYRSGRQADALGAYRQLYRMLTAELGTEPSRQVRDLHQQILNADPALDLEPAPNTAEREPRPGPEAQPDEAPEPAEEAERPVPRQLPADIADFTGREEDLLRLDALLPGDGGSPPTAVVLTAITGTGGVGKTALAVHWAHGVAYRFPDGQLYANLRGYSSESPLEPLTVLTLFLRALGVEAAQVPTDTDEAAALYRSLLADRKVLVLLDNAAHTSQVRPLLPGSAGCLVLVTSRSRLSGLVARESAQPFEIDRLPIRDSVELLANVLGPELVRHEPEAAAKLAELCAGLPLALRLAAANLLWDEQQSLADHVVELSSQDRLDRLRVDDDSSSDAVRAIFDLSYVKLGPDERRSFRQLSLVPGADFSTAAVAALAGVTTSSARRVLDRLVDGHLIERRATGWYAFHDLMRLYAAERTAAEDTEAERSAATDRLVDWYTGNAYAAVALLIPDALRLPQSREISFQAEDFDDHTSALAWLDAERANLLAAVRALADRPGPKVWLLADGLRPYLHLARFLPEWREVAELSLRAAERQGDAHGQAAGQFSLAQAKYHAGDYAGAQLDSERALELARQAGWAEAELKSLNLLAIGHLQQGRVDRSVEWLERALVLARELGTSEAMFLGNLAIAYTRTGQLERAIDYHRQNLELAQRLARSSGSPRDFDVGIGHMDLGEVYRLRGDLALAREHLTQALEIHRELGSEFGIFATSYSLAVTDLDAGNFSQAKEHAETSLRITEETAEHQMEIDLHLLYGDLAERTGDFANAYRDYTRAAQLAEQAGNHYETVIGQIGTASAHLGLGRLDQASSVACTAVAAAQTAGYRLLEGQAKVVLARAHLEAGDAGRARDVAGEALALQAETGHRLGEAHALRLLGDLAERAGDADNAWQYRERAFTIFTSVGAPEAAELEPLLRRA
jgi:DNA-binding SARP family transcriptional activator/tetratricopeptide (TPR) repeat protein